jgi:hypothetical protein
LRKTAGGARTNVNPKSPVTHFSYYNGTDDSYKYSSNHVAYKGAIMFFQELKIGHV